MAQTVTLLRPFHLSFPSTGEHHRLPREKKFAPRRNLQSGEWIPTEVELTDEEANHPYIKDHWADGCIERPEVTAARVQAAQEKQRKEDADNAKELRKAEEALKRATGAHDVHKAAGTATDKELNTPVNELGASRGKSIDETALADALNTPADQLAAGATKSGKKA